MSRKTRGKLKLNLLRDIIGPSKPMTETELPTLRDVLAAGILQKESCSNVSQVDMLQFTRTLTKQILAVYHKANSQFKPGLILITEKSIVNKVERKWTEVISLVNRKVKSTVKKKEVFMKNMDKLFNIFYCKCEIITCFQRGCKEDCLLKLHIICDCPRDHKIPLLEIPFVKDQREKIGRGKLEMGGIDFEETERLQRQIDRTRKDLESLMRRLEEAKAAQNQIAGTSSAQDEEVIEDDDKDTDF